MKIYPPFQSDQRVIGLNAVNIPIHQETYVWFDALKKKLLIKKPPIKFNKKTNIYIIIWAISSQKILSKIE